jgi:hypothetical protein
MSGESLHVSTPLCIGLLDVIPEVMKPLHTLGARMWPGLKVLPPCRQALPTGFKRAQQAFQRIQSRALQSTKTTSTH